MAQHRDDRPHRREAFSVQDLETVAGAITLAEELVSEFYKMSTSQWLKRRYDVKTLRELSGSEIVDGPFAQVVRYKGQRIDSSLESEAYDFYKICLQDHAVLAALSGSAELKLFPFILYIVTHELVHIVRFSMFLQNFEATPEGKLNEEKRVHDLTHRILADSPIPGLPEVFGFYENWRAPMDEVKNP